MDTNGTKIYGLDWMIGMPKDPYNRKVPKHQKSSGCGLWAYFTPLFTCSNPQAFRHLTLQTAFSFFLSMLTQVEPCTEDTESQLSTSLGMGKLFSETKKKEDTTNIKEEVEVLMEFMKSSSWVGPLYLTGFLLRASQSLAIPLLGGGKHSPRGAWSSN